MHTATPKPLSHVPTAALVVVTHLQALYVMCASISSEVMPLKTTSPMLLWYLHPWYHSSASQQHVLSSHDLPSGVEPFHSVCPRKGVSAGCWGAKSTWRQEDLNLLNCQHTPALLPQAGRSQKPQEKPVV